MSIKKPQYQVIIDYFLNKIRAGELKPGDRIPTDSELVEMFQVSRITVTRAIKELEHKGFIYRLKKRGSFINKMENWHNGSIPLPVDASSARSLPILSVVLPFSEEIGFDILRGVEHVCHTAGFYMTVHSSNYDSLKEREIIDKLTRDGIHGIIVLPCSSDRNIDMYSELLIKNYPFVVIDRNIEGLDTPLVVSNNFQGMYDMVSHLIELKHQRIAFVSGSIKEAVSVMDRYRGYCRALIDAEISINHEWVIDDFMDQFIASTRLASEHSELHMEEAKRVLTQLMSLDNKPTAIVSVNDYTAMFFIKAAMQMGISVPDELSVTGFDNLSFGEHLDVPLTTVEQSFFAIGEQAALILIEGQEGHGKQMVKRVLDTKMIVRQSSSRPLSELLK